MQRCLQIRDACGAAITWIEANRGKSPRLDQESGALTLQLRRARNRVRALDQSADRPFAVGFFGLSQAGKSYLISALGANAAGRLDIALGGARLNFLTHINPPGGGKEATGLVTRLTRRPQDAPADHPVRLHLLATAELVKILGNAFFNDFDRERTRFEVDAGQVRKRLADLDQRRRPQPVPGLDADDVQDIQDYFEQRFPHSTYALKADFWPSAIALTAHLETGDRAALFSLLWGEVPELTGVFRLLADALGQLRHSPRVDCPIAALVAPAGDGGWTPVGSIVDVDVLDRLGKDPDDRLSVLPEARVQTYFGLSRELFDDLIDELVTGADRHGLERIIAAALRRNENLAGALRQQLASRQVDAVDYVLSGFIDSLEACVPPGDPDGPATAPGAPPGTATLFAPPPPIPRGQVPDLAAEPAPFTRNYIQDWLKALVALAVNNAGHTPGQEIPPDQNRRLGEILAILGGATPEAPR